MKKKNNVTASEPSRFEPTDDDIRAYAYDLYEQRGRDPGHDLDDWLEARAYLQSLSKPHRSHPLRMPLIRALSAARRQAQSGRLLSQWQIRMLHPQAQAEATQYLLTQRPQGTA